MKNKGVSLVELMIVIIVMGIIASFTVISVSQIIDNTKKSRVYSDVLAVSQAVSLYCADHQAECTPASGRTYRTIRYSAIEGYLPNLDDDYYKLNINIARVSANNFQNPQVRLRAEDDSDYSWYRFRDPKDDRYDRDYVAARTP